MQRTRQVAAVVAVVMAVASAAPAAAGARSTRPAVSTGGAADVTQQTATLLGSVDPGGAQTTYWFEVGTTRSYGSSTVPAAAGSGTRAQTVSGPVVGMLPATTYHYRLVARNRNGTAYGADRTLRSRRQPLALSLAATPNPVPWGAPTTLAGVLTGTGNARREVVLQANPFPYTQGFAAVGNRLVTDAAGGFAFPLLSVPLNTQYRAVVADAPSVASAVVSLGVAVRVRTAVQVRRARRGRGKATVRFSGTIRPARDGAQIAIQKLRGGTWRTIGGTITRHAGGGVSRYAKRLRLRHGGSFRVWAAINDGNLSPNAGRSVRLRLFRR